MATLALEKLASVEDAEYLMYREQSIRLIFYLLRSSTTEEMAAPLKEIFMDPFTQSTKIKTVRMSQLLLYATNNFDEVELEAHL
mmetsp:Transcript_20935/g.25736  ORF Transcript_20935/g.25736 Transcript_20935/m.25736 type:complete len:84 (+) Transcript_20935:1440-1691(+)